MSQNLDKVLIILERVKRSGKGWVARCPAHEDRHPSLSVGVGDDGRVLLHCYAGCDVQAVVAALGLQMADLYPDAHTTPPSTRATVQHQPANPHPSADSAVAGNDPGGSAEGTVAPLQPDQQGMCVRVLGCTLEAYAQAKRLPVDFLRSLGLSDAKYVDAPAGGRSTASLAEAVSTSTSSRSAEGTTRTRRLLRTSAHAELPGRPAGRALTAQGHSSDARFSLLGVLLTDGCSRVETTWSPAVRPT
jgi:CHC2 zinc finger